MTKKKNNTMIRMFHVYKRYGSKAALNDLTLDIATGEFLFVTGPSGAGKTTLLKLIYMGERVSEGDILVDNQNLGRVAKKKIPALRRKIGIIFQDFKLIPSRTVFENVALVLETAGEKADYIQKRVRSLLRTVQMENKTNAWPLSLSGGEQQRVAVARAVAARPKIILADEPTGSLDPESAKIIFDLLNSFHEQNATVIVATHDKETIESTDKRIVNLYQGGIRYDRAALTRED